MTSTIRGSDNFDSAGGNACKAWVRFNGTGTVAINAAYNVSSITDNGTGDYTVNFTNAMVDANFVTLGEAKESYIGNNGDYGFSLHESAQATTYVRVNTGNQTSTTKGDCIEVHVAIFH
jgi:hypothetical protein